MIDIEDRGHKPNLAQMCELVGKPLFGVLCRYMDDEYKAIQSVEYSGDKVLLGWNLKFKKAGKTLCTVYPRQGHFFMLLVVGRKEKQRVEEILPDMSGEFQNIYNETKEGMGQRWLLLDLTNADGLYADALKVVRIRRVSMSARSAEK